MIPRTAVIAAARGWLGTPFRHQARLRGVGVDCGGLVVMAAREAGCLVADHPGPYTRMPDGQSLRRVVEGQCAPIAALEPAAVALMAWETEPQHVALVATHGERWTIIHAYMDARRVVEHGLGEEWMRRIVGLYRLPGVA